MAPAPDAVTLSPIAGTVPPVTVYVAPSPRHGLGVFASEPIPAGRLIHVAPVIVISATDLELIDDTPLRGLVYGWEHDEPGACAFALGFGSLFNHDERPNCVYHRVDAGDIHPATGEVSGFDALTYTTLRAVELGEELLIDYSGGDPSVLWFDPR
jgi:uncharacterized protein